MALPVTHREDNQKLSADGKVELFEFQFYGGGVVFYCPTKTVTWQGNEYKYWPVQMTGVSANSDGETSRPKMTIGNFSYAPDGTPIRGVFSALHINNKVEGGTVIRRRVLNADIEANNNIKEEMRWKVSRVSSLTADLIVLELRNTLDGPRFTIPARKFVPPEFPQVSLY